jgi:hypothetical protein
MMLMHNDFEIVQKLFPDLQLHVKGCQREQRESTLLASNDQRRRPSAQPSTR